MDITNEEKNKKRLSISVCIFLFFAIPLSLSFFSESFADFIISASALAEEYDDYLFFWRSALYVTTIIFWTDLCRALSKGNKIIYKQLVQRIWLVIAIILIVELKNFL